MIITAMQPSQEASGAPMRQTETWTSSSSDLHPQLQPDEMMDNGFFQPNHDYNRNVYGSSWHPQSQLMQQHSQNRSNPIAIVRGGALQDKPEDSDSDESIIDVELDAIKLRQKYGGETHQEDKKALKAPYLGSLSRSEGFLMSLPPMALSDDFHDPPADIMSYGSLRDSHQKGRFLDGPSSYREPRSGRIIKLDRRVGYQAAPPAQSIGDRIRQAQKQKEIRKQQEKNESAGGNTSSLSAMMNQVSQQQENPRSAQVPVTGGFSNMGVETQIPTFGGLDDDYDSPSMMMSTSLTAFEILKTSSFKPEERTPGASFGRPPNSLFPVEVAPDDVQFKPLARSNSDPLPNPHAVGFQTLQYIHPMQQQHLHQAIDPQTISVNGTGAANFVDAMMYDGISQHHSPDMDGAFDMDV